MAERGPNEKPELPVRDVESPLPEADEEPAIVYRNRRRDGTCLANSCLGGPGDLDVGRVRQAVADQGRLESHDRLAVAQCVGDLRGYVEAVTDRELTRVPCGHRRSVASTVAKRRVAPAVIIEA